LCSPRPLHAQRDKLKLELQHQSTATGFRAEVIAALDAELTRTIVPPADCAALAQDEPAEGGRTDGIVPPPRFLRSGTRSREFQAADF